MRNKICGVVLAAGLSIRMTFNKLTAEIGGRAMVRYAVENIKGANIDRILVVIGNDRLNVKLAINESVEWVTQEVQLGTGDAAEKVIPYLKDENSIVILFGDCPFLDSEIIEETISIHYQEKADITLATSRLRDPKFLGRINRNEDGKVKKVIDGRNDPSVDFGFSEIFTGLSVWTREAFTKYIPILPHIDRGKSKIEKNLPDAVELCISDGGKVTTYQDVSEDDALGPNVPIEFERATEYLRSKIRANLRFKGVRLPDPQAVVIDFDVLISKNTIIQSNTHLLGTTKIGSNCEIGPDTTLRNCIVGKNCIIGQGSWTDQVFPENSRASDRLATVHHYFRQPHYLIPEEAKFCFVLLPFKDPYLSLFKNVIRPVLQNYDFECRIVDTPGPGIVIDDIWNNINRASLIIAEISESNRNVWYELGLAHALNKKTIMLFRKAGNKNKFPFDIEHQRILVYEPDKGNLAAILTVWLEDYSKKND